MRNARLSFAWILAAWSFCGAAWCAEEPLPDFVEKAQAAVVTIFVYEDGSWTPSQGTGFFIAPGRVATARHVVDTGTSGRIETADGKLYTITGVLDDDPEMDLALIAVDAPDDAAPFVPVAAELVGKGDDVIIIGSFRARVGRVNRGRVEDVRETAGFRKILELHAPLDRGVSGGPVFNMTGKVTGVMSQGSRIDELGFLAVSALPLGGFKTGEPVDLAVYPAKPEGRHEKLIAARKLALLDLWTGDPRKALGPLRDYAKSKPDDWQAWFQLGVCYQELRRNDEAVEALKKALFLKDDVARVHRHLATVYALSQRHAKALNSCKEAIRLAPEDERAHLALAETYRALDRQLDAIDAIKEAIRLQPRKANSHIRLGNAYADIEQYDKAMQAFQKALTLQPGYPLAYNCIARAFARQDELEKAVVANRRALVAMPNYPSALFDLGWLHAELEQHQKALEYSRKFLDVVPDSAMGYNNLASSYEDIEDYEKAIDNYKESIRLDPQSGWPHNGLASVYEKQGLHEKALLAAQRAIRLGGDDDRVTAYSHSVFARVHFARGEHEAAQKETEIVNSLDDRVAKDLQKELAAKEPRSTEVNK